MNGTADAPPANHLRILDIAPGVAITVVAFACYWLDADHDFKAPLWLLGVACLVALVVAELLTQPYGGLMAWYGYGRDEDHYSVFHIGVVLECQQVKNWPFSLKYALGLGGAATLVPLLVSPWILRRFRRGPVEAVVHWLARSREPQDVH